MIRAALEGVLYNLYTVYLALIEVMNETPKMIKQQVVLRKVKYGVK